VNLPLSLPITHHATGEVCLNNLPMQIFDKKTTIRLFEAYMYGSELEINSGGKRAVELASKKNVEKQSFLRGWGCGLLPLE
jgi:hypothetical protein